MAKCLLCGERTPSARSQTATMLGNHLEAFRVSAEHCPNSAVVPPNSVCSCLVFSTGSQRSGCCAAIPATGPSAVRSRQPGRQRHLVCSEIGGLVHCTSTSCPRYSSVQGLDQVRKQVRNTVRRKRVTTMSGFQGVLQRPRDRKARASSCKRWQLQRMSARAA